MSDASLDRANGDGRPEHEFIRESDPTFELSASGFVRLISRGHSSLPILDPASTQADAAVADPLVG